MVRFDGEKYPLHESMWGGEFVGYLCNGKYQYEQPIRLNYKGYIVTPEGVVAVYKSGFPWGCLPAVLLVVAMFICVSNKKPINSYYPVSFAESPVLEDGVLYCSVVNVSERELTVNFTDNAGHDSMLTLLRPGETLPTAPVDFVPTAIVYDQQYQFELEVQYD